MGKVSTCKQCGLIAFGPHAMDKLCGSTAPSGQLELRTPIRPSFYKHPTRQPYAPSCGASHLPTDAPFPPPGT